MCRFLEIELELLALTIHERAWRFSMLRRLLLNQRIVFSRRGYCFPLNLRLVNFTLFFFICIFWGWTGALSSQRLLLVC